MINVLNIYKIFFYLFITFETTSTSKIFSVQALVDSEATEIFINYSFMKKYYMNTHKLPKSILVYNIDNTSDKNRQITKVVDVVLCY